MIPIDIPTVTDESMLRSITIYWNEEFIKVIENTELIYEIINMYECYVRNFVKESKIWFIDIEDIPFEEFINLLRDVDMLSMPCEIKIKL